METAYIERCNNMHLIKKETLSRRQSQRKSTPFRPLPEIPENEPPFFDAQYQRDTWWNDDLYEQEKRDFMNNFDKSLEFFEDDDSIADSHVSDKNRYPLFNLWTVNRQPPHTSALPNKRPQLNFTRCENPVNDREVIPQL